MSGLLVEKIRALSMDSTQELQIPSHGEGIWPKGVKLPVPFRKEQAKIFLDTDCLQDGQSWLSGFVQGLNPKSQPQNPKHPNPKPKPQTPNPKPQTPNPKPQTRSTTPQTPPGAPNPAPCPLARCALHHAP